MASALDSVLPLASRNWSCNGTVPCFTETHGTEIHYIPYEFEDLYFPERIWNEFDKTILFEWGQEVWYASIILAVLYAVGVHVGQKLMENRPAFELKWPLILWNGGLSLFSLMGTIRMGEEFLYVMRTRPLLDSISYSCDMHQPAAFWGLLFTISKVFELGDTVFVVLRKKPLIFLHWYHHAAVLVYTVHATSELVAGARVFATMNYAIHTIMYAYFSLTAAGIKFPRLLSMTITTLQTAQMFVGVAITFTVAYLKFNGNVVQQSVENLAICFTIYVSFAVLFMSFFAKSYFSEKGKKVKVQ